jgi:hypothetical protein
VETFTPRQVRIFSSDDEGTARLGRYPTAVRYRRGICCVHPAEIPVWDADSSPKAASLATCRRTSALKFRDSGIRHRADDGSNEIRSRMPVAAASRSSVRVDGFTRPLSRRAITACVVCIRSASCSCVRFAKRVGNND